MSDIIISNEEKVIKITNDENVINLVSGSKKIIITGTGSQGVPGPAGGETWGTYSLRVQYTGVDTTIASGLVKECLDGATTVYRFINSTNNARSYPIEDSFYLNFDGTNLTNIIVTRG